MQSANLEPVLVRGGGVAANVCNLLLTRAGRPVIIEASHPPPLPAVMIGAQSQQLFASTFERNDLFSGCHPIERRIVAWGKGAEPVEVPHAAVVISGSSLSKRLRTPNLGTHGAAGWSIHAVRPVPVSLIEQTFGANRRASAFDVELRPGTAANACWMESVEHGWLFLLSAGAGRGWLLAAGAAPEVLLSESRIVVEQIGSAGDPSAHFACYPQVAQPLGGAAGRWLACGSAALAFDPICGDGSAQALREAILASAVVIAASSCDPDEVVDHYRLRLLAGFKRHLELCWQFYSTGGDSAWWIEQREAIRRGLAWCSAQLPSPLKFRYRLNGYALERLG